MYVYSYVHMIMYRSHEVIMFSHSVTHLGLWIQQSDQENDQSCSVINKLTNNKQSQSQTCLSETYVAQNNNESSFPPYNLSSADERHHLRQGAYRKLLSIALFEHWRVNMSVYLRSCIIYVYIYMHA